MDRCRPGQQSWAVKTKLLKIGENLRCAEIFLLKIDTAVGSV